MPDGMFVTAMSFAKPRYRITRRFEPSLEPVAKKREITCLPLRAVSLT